MKTEQKDLIKATVPILKEHGVLLTTHFYNRMFSHNPELKNMFNMGNQQNKKQQTALAMAVLAYAENIENPSALFPVVDSIGHKHTSLDIRPEHYQIVGKHLIASIAEVLGDAALPEILDAWSAAYSQLAQLMSGHEASLYSNQVKKTGGWTGWRPFLVKDKTEESAEITSFYLYPTDGGAVADFTPGQYISVRLFLPELNLLQPRQYSLSNTPNGTYYRISVKKEKGSVHPDGIISNRLHDTIKVGDVIDVSAPAGNFVLNVTVDTPVVFISGGVGQTPLVSMLETLIKQEHQQPITWIHGCRGEHVHAFKETIAAWSEKSNQLNSHIFYDVLESDSTDSNIHEGWVNLDLLDETILQAKTKYYICGPATFIRKHFEFLTAKGVDKSTIHFEEFGPASLQLHGN
ncbi:NO-inducible flavohemoprotein [Olivibacter domesticus]|uniref:Flavohemoprotein n=1 Tax=Olivibacter domesticus TaxID=407022 RepID=A0A1H7HCZ5_OLID1|nr:NO-inducible flavohemoprotein [Olivibacter domesticus]SEK48189.1 nitric oxide dioxygenase [Olivibacter domesticus]